MGLFERKEDEMENIAPPLRLVMSLRRSIENGDSMASALRKYLGQSEDDLTSEITKLLLQQPLTSEDREKHSFSPCREALFTVIQSGLAGQSVFAPLVQLEKEILALSYIDIEKTIQKIPLQLIWPVLFMQFPAYLMLLLGPLLDYLTRNL